MRAVRLLIVSLVALTACAKASDESKAKRAPVAPPPPTVELPADLSLTVEVDGQPAAPITRASLAAIAPDFRDEERSAWRLSSVLGAPFAREGAVVEAISPSGIAISLRRPRSDAEPQPVLFLTRRGDVVVAVVDPNDPFPTYHGQGGRLRRPGDPQPRLSSVSTLRVSVESDGARGEWAAMEQSGKQALLALELMVGGKATRATAEQLDALPVMTIRGDQGDKRVVWSLRDLVAVVGGDKVRATQVVGEGDPAPVEAAAWADAKQTPILRTNRRGELRFQWIGHDGKPREAGQVRGVKRIELAE